MLELGLMFQPWAELDEGNSRFFPVLIQVANDQQLWEGDVKSLVEHFTRGAAAAAFANKQKKHGTLEACEILAKLFHTQDTPSTNDQEIRDWQLDTQRDLAPQIHQLMLCYTSSSVPKALWLINTLVKEKALSFVPLDIKAIMDIKENRYQKLHGEESMPMEMFIRELDKAMKAPPSPS